MSRCPNKGRHYVVMISYSMQPTLDEDAKKEARGVYVMSTSLRRPFWKFSKLIQRVLKFVEFCRNSRKSLQLLNPGYDNLRNRYNSIRTCTHSVRTLPNDPIRYEMAVFAPKTPKNRRYSKEIEPSWERNAEMDWKLLETLSFVMQKWIGAEYNYGTLLPCLF